ncbi:hypothetical protein HK102_008380 [Quaeritorhiza haematococci]|nr:hypothetical protein HK102_008380 [Quaeritorhiza haematococci]
MDAEYQKKYAFERSQWLAFFWGSRGVYNLGTGGGPKSIGGGRHHHHRFMFGVGRTRQAVFLCLGILLFIATLKTVSRIFVYTCENPIPRIPLAVVDDANGGLAKLKVTDDNQQQLALARQGDRIGRGGTISTIPWQPKKIEKISLIAACKNRHPQLHRALKSWITADPGPSEIVLVDWGSNTPIERGLPKSLLADPRIKIVQVPEVKEWVLTWAYNLAANMVTPAGSANSQGTEDDDERHGAGHKKPVAEEETWWMLKTDCDTLIQEDFFSAHPRRPGIYYAGDWRTARHQNEQHLNGVFFVRYSDFHKVNGFDERIQTYGWDDSDLYARLNDTGLKLHHFDFDTVYHIDHPTVERTSNQDEVEMGPAVETWRNHLIADLLPKWDSTYEGSQYMLVSKGVDRFVATQVYTPQSNRDLISRDKYEEISRTALQMVLRKYGVPWKVLWLPMAYLQRMVPTYEKGRMIIIHVQHGLSNRLRAMASALVLARKTNRHFRMIWPSDEHCYARFDQLFENKFDVWDSVDTVEIKANHIDRYNYMEPEPGAKKYQYIEDETLNHIYVKSAYILYHGLVTEADIKQVLLELSPVKEIRDMMNQIGSTHGMIGVHIRSVAPRRELPTLPDSAYPPTEWRNIASFREMSAVKVFASEMERLIQESPEQRFFVTADTLDAITTLRNRFGDERIKTLDNQGCLNRNVRCLHFAVADLLLLGKTSAILGSYYSSFTEVAGTIAGVKPQCAGMDFPGVKEDHLIREHVKGNGNGVLYIYWNTETNYARLLPEKKDYRFIELRKSAESVMATKENPTPLAIFYDTDVVPRELGHYFKFQLAINATTTWDGDSVAELLKRAENERREQLQQLEILQNRRQQQLRQNQDLELDGEEIGPEDETTTASIRPKPLIPSKLAKIRGLANSPFEITFYLDTDTLVCGDLKGAFKMLGNFDILLAKEHHKSADSEYAWNSGVMVYKNNNATQRFFKLWEQIYLRDCVLAGKSNLDLCALPTALKESAEFLKYGTLEPIYNIRLSNSDWFDKSDNPRKYHSQMVSAGIKVIHTRRLALDLHQNPHLCHQINKRPHTPRVIGMNAQRWPVVYFTKDQCLQGTGQLCDTVDLPS